MKLDLLPDDDVDSFDFVPWINCLFLLMFFLMTISSGFLAEAEGHRVTLPTAETVQLIARDDADMVTYAANDQLWWQTSAGESALDSLADLEVKVRERSEPNRPVIVRCDRRCTYEQYTRLKNALLNAGVTTIFEEMGSRPSADPPK